MRNNGRIKNDRKIEAIENITPDMDHYWRNGQIGDTDP